MSVFKKILNFVLNIIFPPKCVFCGKLLEPYSKHEVIDGHDIYCNSCATALRFCKDYKCCIKCGKPSASFNSDDMCLYCEKKSIGFKRYRGISVLFYEDAVRSSVLRYKLGEKKHYAKAYSYMMYKTIKTEYDGIAFDIVTSAPPTAGFLKSRKNFDHAELIARKIAKKMDIKYIPCLKKLSTAKHQRGLSYSERIKNLDGNIKMLKQIDVRNKTILLIDDVCTTGSTLKECAKVLLRNGAKEIFSATLATVVKEKSGLLSQDYFEKRSGNPLKDEIDKISI